MGCNKDLKKKLHKKQRKKTVKNQLFCNMKDICLIGLNRFVILPVVIKILIINGPILKSKVRVIKLTKMEVNTTRATIGTLKACTYLEMIVHSAMLKYRIVFHCHVSVDCQFKNEAVVFSTYYKIQGILWPFFSRGVGAWHH